MITATCPQCQKQFAYYPCRPQVTCSERCKEDSRRVFTDVEIREIAANGVALNIAAELAGTTGPHRVTNALKRAGLYEQWRERRYA